jgi:hypothetical protein
MPNNLHISYDLNSPGQTYDKVAGAIMQLGSWAKIHYSFWYVKSPLTAEQARNALLNVIDANHSLYVVDATNSQAAWHNLSPEVAAYVRENWNVRKVA